MIDSGLVPRGKGEKQPGEGDEIVSETVCLQRAGDRKIDGIPIEEWACECDVCRLLKPLWGGGVAKASLNGRSWHAHNPKPGELSIARVNLDESQGEARTHAPCNTRRWAVDRREILIELGDSWLSSK